MTDSDMAGACSCHLDYPDFGTDAAWTIEYKARKEHKCIECREVIKRGERYHRHTTIYDGSYYNSKICNTCLKIGDDLIKCWVMGELDQELRDRFGVSLKNE